MVAMFLLGISCLQTFTTSHPLTWNLTAVGKGVRRRTGTVPFLVGSMSRTEGFHMFGCFSGGFVSAQEREEAAMRPAMARCAFAPNMPPGLLWCILLGC